MCGKKQKGPDCYKEMSVKKLMNQKDKETKGDIEKKDASVRHLLRPLQAYLYHL